MVNKPLFFRDEGEMGDVLEQARDLSVKIEELTNDVELQFQNLDEFKEDLEESINREGINKRIGNKILKTKKSVTDFMKDWRKNKSVLGDKEDELKFEQQKLLSAKEEIVQTRTDLTDEESAPLSSEIDKLNQLSSKIEEKLEKIESTKAAIDRIFEDNESEIKDKVMSFDDTEFMYINYLNLVKSKIFAENIRNPLYDEEYSEQDLNLKETDHSFTLKAQKGIFKNKSQFNVDFRFLLPHAEEGFYHRKIGIEHGDLITDFLSSNNFKSFSALVLVSPTGWTDAIKSRVKSVNSTNQYILLVDLFERVIFTNNTEASKNIIDLFTPVSLEEETQKVIELLNSEINNGTGQFRADKVSNKYKLSRKLVLNAFERMQKSGLGDLINTEEGAKDIIFLPR